MAQSNPTAEFLERCKASMAEFEREEGELHPEHFLMLYTEHGINMRFKSELDEIKDEFCFLPKEIYISSEISSESSRVITSVDLGSTLLDLQVVFRPLLNVRRLAKEPCKENGGVVSFSFEWEVMQEYYRCVHLLNMFKWRLKTADNARAVPQKEREAALVFVDSARTDALERLRDYRHTKAPNPAKKQVLAHIQHLDLLEARLKMLDPRRTRP